jgi:hypothetical protein
MVLTSVVYGLNMSLLAYGGGEGITAASCCGCMMF